MESRVSGISITRSDVLRKLSELELESEQVELISNPHVISESNKANINEQKNMLLPISTLPSEILYLIFLHVVRFVPGIMMRPGDNPYPMPLTLASVCRRWRSITLAHSMLWTHIALGHIRDHNLLPCVSRSADLMLDITLYDGYLTEHRVPNLETLLHALSKEAYRWQSLHLDVENPRAFSPLWTQKHAASLQYMCIVGRVNPGYSQYIRPALSPSQNNLHTFILIYADLLKGFVAPNLRNLTLIGGPYNNMLSESLWDILTSTTKLQTLCLGLTFLESSDEDIHAVLPHLQHFTIYVNEHDNDVLGDLLDMISAPALQSMELTGEESRPVPRYPPHIRPSFCTGVPGQIDWRKLMMDGKPRYPTAATAIIHGVSKRTADI